MRIGTISCVRIVRQLAAARAEMCAAGDAADDLAEAAGTAWALTRAVGVAPRERRSVSMTARRFSPSRGA